ncbi:ABC-type nitrate/sulfonate/bicarbonate transport system ATPase subunit [Bradyrhizobium sp. S3.12.5]
MNVRLTLLRALINDRRLLLVNARTTDLDRQTRDLLALWLVH